MADGKTPCERRFGESFKGPIVPFGALVEYLTNSERDKARIHQFGKKRSPGIFPGYTLIARRLNAKEVLITHRDGEFVFPVGDGSATLSGRDHEFQEPTLRREHTVKRENLSGESQGDREEFQPEETKDDAATQED